jgi:hypothetical protein
VQRGLSKSQLQSPHLGMSHAGTLFTCFTGTKVQKMTQNGGGALDIASDALSPQQQAAGGVGVGLRAHQYAADMQCQGIGCKISNVRH